MLDDEIEGIGDHKDKEALFKLVQRTFFYNSNDELGLAFEFFLRKIVANFLYHYPDKSVEGLKLNRAIKRSMQKLGVKQFIEQKVLNFVEDG